MQSDSSSTYFKVLQLIYNFLNMSMYLYAIGTLGNQQKIGFSKNPEKRLKTLQTANSEKLYLHYKFEINEETARQFENFVHRDLNYNRTRGEWFNSSVENIINQMKYHEIMRETTENMLYLGGLARSF